MLHLQTGSAPGFSRMQISFPFNAQAQCVCQRTQHAAIACYDSEMLEGPRDGPISALTTSVRCLSFPVCLQLSPLGGGCHFCVCVPRK